jgi:hypothetical protein
LNAVISNWSFARMLCCNHWSSVLRTVPQDFWVESLKSSTIPTPQRQVARGAQLEVRDGLAVLENNDVGGREVGQGAVIAVSGDQREAHFAHPLADHWSGFGVAVGND